MKSILFSLLMLLAAAAIAQPAKHKKILIVATSADNLVSKPNDHTWGCYMPEISAFFARLYKAGYTANDIDIVTLTGGKVPQAAGMHYPKKYKVPDSEKDAMSKKAANAMKPADINAADYNVIYFAGGFSCFVDLPHASPIGAIATAIYEQGGVVAAVCDGICGLETAVLKNGDPIARGKKITLNGNDNNTREALAAQGAIVTNEKLVQDGRLVTAKGVRPVAVASAVLSIVQ